MVTLLTKSNYIHLFYELILSLSIIFLGFIFFIISQDIKWICFLSVIHAQNTVPSFLPLTTSCNGKKKLFITRILNELMPLSPQEWSEKVLGLPRDPSLEEGKENYGYSGEGYLIINNSSAEVIVLGKVIVKCGH